MACNSYPGHMTTPPTATDWLRLDQQICFSLNAASRAFGSVYRVILKDLGITYPQYLVMLVLWEHGDLPVKKLGEHLRLDSGTLSPLLKRLETAGLGPRERSAPDAGPGRAPGPWRAVGGRAAHRAGRRPARARGAGAAPDRLGDQLRHGRDPRP